VPGQASSISIDQAIVRNDAVDKTRTAPLRRRPGAGEMGLRLVLS
jgi:hypothetical protein